MMTEKYAPVSIGRVIRDALAFDPKNWNQKGFSADSIPQTLSDLLSLFEERKVGYVLVGGIALLSYVKGRNTSDLDLIIDSSELKKIPEIEVSHADKQFGRGLYGNLQLDFLFTDHPLFDLVNRSYCQPRKFQERTINTATVEGLLLLKLYALPSLYRQGDFTRVGLYENDIAALMKEYSPDHGLLLTVLFEYLDENDQKEVKNILEEIRGRINRFNLAK